MCYVTFVTPTIFLSHDVNHPKGIAGTILCAVVTGGGLAHIGAEASLFTVLAVAFERYFAVVHPYGNRGKLTFHKVKVCFFEMKCYAGRNLSRPYAGTCWRKLIKKQVDISWADLMERVADGVLVSPLYSYSQMRFPYLRDGLCI